MFSHEPNIIGSLIVSPSLLAECDLSSSEFLSEQNALIYQAILDLESATAPIDSLSVCEILHKQTGRDYRRAVGEIVKDYGFIRDPGAMRHQCEQVRHASRIEASKAVAQRLLDFASKSDTAIDDAIRDLMALNQSRKNHDHSLADSIKEGLNEVDDVLNGRIKTISTGLTKLDAALGGLRNSDLIIVGARPSIGKTAFMVNLALKAISPVGIISTEQPSRQIGLRAVAIDGKVSLHRMRTANLEQSDWSKMTASMMRLKDRVIRINDKPLASLADICRQARKWKQIHQIEALYVDYVQHIPGDNRLPRHEQVDVIVKGLKGLAMELDIPVIALAQVNRKVEDRANKRPLLSDLKDSGSIEQEADQIMLLYRDDVYDPDTAYKGIMEIDIQKNRHGPIGVVRAAWLPEYIAVKDLELTVYGGTG